jgi:RloB-like protein
MARSPSSYLLPPRERMMARRSRFPDLLRRRAVREPKRRFLVVCEGRTERLYFRAFAIEFRYLLVDIEIEHSGGVPRTLVECAARRKKDAVREAKRSRDSFLQFDDVWCVFDVDEHPHIPAARDQAHANGIRLAVSNPCFELWVLLHFQVRSAFLDRDKAHSLLRKHLRQYAKIVPFDRIKEHYDTAVSRARNLDHRCESAGRPGDNPSTGVYLLTEEIRQSTAVPDREAAPVQISESSPRRRKPSGTVSRKP